MKRVRPAPVRWWAPQAGALHRQWILALGLSLAAGGAIAQQATATLDPLTFQDTRSDPVAAGSLQISGPAEVQAGTTVSYTISHEFSVEVVDTLYLAGIRSGAGALNWRVREEGECIPGVPACLVIPSGVRRVSDGSTRLSGSLSRLQTYAPGALAVGATRTMQVKIPGDASQGDTFAVVIIWARERLGVGSAAAPERLDVGTRPAFAATASVTVTRVTENIRVGWEQPRQTVVEGADSVEVCANLLPGETPLQAGQSVLLPYESQDVSARADTDYQAASGSLLLTDTEPRACVKVTLLTMADQAANGIRNFLLQLLNAEGMPLTDIYADLQNRRTIVDIVDDDAATATITLVDDVSGEIAGGAHLDGPLEVRAGTTATYKLSRESSDGSTQGASLNFHVGIQSGSGQVLDWAGADRAAIASSRAAGMCVEDSAACLVVPSSGVLSGFERFVSGTGRLVYVTQGLSLDAVHNMRVRVSPDATPGQTFRIIVIRSLGSFGSEQINPPPGTSAVSTVTILDAPSTVRATWSEAHHELPEGETQVEVCAIFAAGGELMAGQSVVLSYTTQDGTAAAGTAYTTSAGTLTLTADAPEDCATIALLAADDDVANGDRAFTVELTQATGVPSDVVYVSLPGASATVEIIDDEARPPGVPFTVFLSSAVVAVTEGAGSTTVAVTVQCDEILGCAPQGRVTVPWTITPTTATAGVDYTAPGAATLAFEAGDFVAGTASQDIVININEDQLYEGDESLVITLLDDITVTPIDPEVGSGDSFTTTQATTLVTIRDNDMRPDTFALTVSPGSVAESARVTTVTVTVELTGAVRFSADTNFALTVGGAAIEGTDYNLSGTRTVVIPAEARMGTTSLRLTPTRDGRVEGPETLVFTASAVGFAPQTGVLLLTDGTATGPGDITLSLDPARLPEGAGSTTFRVSALLSGVETLSLSDALQLELSLEGTAVAGTDYVASGIPLRLAIDPNSGAGTANLELTPTPDTIAEGSESIVVVGTLIMSPSDDFRVVNRPQILLQDDDAVPATLTLTASPATLTEGQGETNVEVTAMLGDGSVTLPGDLELTLVLGGTATPGDMEDYTVTGTLLITIAAGATEGTTTLTITPYTDDRVEPLQRIDITGTVVGEDYEVVPFTVPLTDPSSLPPSPPPQRITGSSSVQQNENELAVGTYNYRTDIAATLPVGWSLRGDDASLFAIDNSGALRFLEPPDFEVRDSYMLIVVATVGGEESTLAVDIAVRNVAETGTIALEGVPLVGATLTATLTDPDVPDGNFVDLVWSWEREDAGRTVSPISSADQATYRLTAEDIDHVVRVTATYKEVPGRDAVTLTIDTVSGVAAPTATYQVGFSVATPVQTREGATVVLQVQIAGGATATGTLTVRYRITDDSTDSSDYTDTTPDGVLTLLPGASAGSINIAIEDELLSEVDEQFTVTLLDNATSSLDTELVQLGTRSARQLTIAASDPITVLLAGPAVIVEGSSAKYTVSLSGGQPTALLQLSYSTADGAATAGKDYTALPATDLRFTDATPQSITVQTTANAIINASPRDFLLRLTNPTGGGGPAPVLGTSELSIAIADDEGEAAYAALSLSPVVALAESDSTVNLTLTATLLGSPRTTPTTIQLGTEGTATAGTDYTDFTLTLTIPANDPNAMVALPIELLNDDTVENPETIVITGTATGLTISGTTLLLNDDGDSATLNLTGPKDVLEAPDAAAEFTLSLTAPLAEALTVAWSITPGTATALEDYATATPPVTINAGATEATFSVIVHDDAVPGELPETFTVTLDGATGPQADRVTVTPTPVLVTITEPSPPPVITGSGAVQLNEGILEVGTYTADLSVSWSLRGADASLFVINATSGALSFLEPPDFEARDSYMLIVVATAAGSEEGTLVVNITVRDVAETGTVELEGAPLVGATLTATLTDPDVPDGNFTDLVWSWEREDTGRTVSKILGADQATYRLTASDIDHVVRVTATYKEVPTGAEFMVTAATVSGVTAPTATYQVAFSVATPVQTREGATVALQVQIAGGATATGTLTVRYRITDDSTDSSDYTDTIPDGVLTLSPGVSAGPINIAIEDELLSEVDEQFTVTLLDNATSSLGTELVQLGTRSERQLTIAASDPITVLLAGPAVIVEGSSAEYTVSLSGGQPTALLQLSYSTADGTATAGKDYTALPATDLRFTDATPQSITVQTTANVITDASPRDFLLRLTNPTGGGGPAPVLGTSELSIAIADDEGEAAYAALSVSPGDALAESDSTVNLTLTATLLGGSRATPTTIRLGTEGTATAGTDYTDFTLTLTIPANAPSAMVALPIELLNDDIVENPETIVITGTATGLTIPGIELLLNDDGDSATLNLTGPKDVLEGTAAEFTLRLTAPLAADLTVAWSITPGTATALEDYATETPPVTINAGATEATFSVIVHDDAVPGESPETFTVTLDGATGPQADRVTVPRTPVLVTITEPPPASPLPVITGSGAVQLDEGVLAVGAYTADLSVSWSLRGADASLFVIDATSGVLSFLAAPDFEARDSYMLIVVATATGGGESTLAVNITVRNVAETGTVELEGAPLVGATLTATLTDSDVPDGNFTGLVWSWERVESGGTVSEILGADQATYRLTASDIDHVVRVTATYRETPAGAEFMVTADTASGVAEPTATYQVGFSAATPVQTREGATVALQVQIAGGATATGTLTVRYRITDDSTDSSDYTDTAPDGVLTLLPGASAGSINIAIEDELLSEVDEQFTVTLLDNATSSLGTELVQLGTRSVRQLTIAASDPIRATLQGPEFVEEGELAEYTVTLALDGNTIETSAELSYSTADGTATAGTDYNAVSDMLRFTSGGSQRITVQTTGNDDDDGVRQYDLSLSAPGGAYIVFAPDPATVTTSILDNDGASESLRLSVSGAENLREDSGNTTVTVTATLLGDDALADNLSITLEVPDLPDLVLPALSIVAGEQAGTAALAINPVDDNIVEQDRQILIAASAAPLRVIPAQLTIVDGDTAEVSIVGPATAVPEGQPAEFTISLSAPVDGSVSVTATAEADVAIATDFAPTEHRPMLPGSVMVATVQDTLSEPDEAFNVRLTGLLPPSALAARITLGTAVASATIAASDPITVLLAGPAVIVEGSAAEYIVSLSGGQPTAPLQLSYSTVAGTATAGTDYTALSATDLRFTDATPQSITVQTTANTITDTTPRNFLLRLTNPTGGGGPAPVLGTPELSISIADDEAEATSAALSVSPGDALAESAGTVNLTLAATLLGGSRATPTTIRLGTEGTATAGTDYTDFTLTLTIPANDLSAMVALPIELLNDNIVEDPETIVITGTATGLTISGTTLLLNDDGDSATLNLTGPKGVLEGTAAEFTLSLTAPLAEALTVAWSITPGTATALEDYATETPPVTINAGAREATFSVTVHDTVSGELPETFTVTLDGATGPQADRVTVTPTSVLVTITEPSLDLTGDGNVDINDAAAFYYTYALPSALQNSDLAAAILGPLATAAGTSVAALMQAVATLSSNPAADLNRDGTVDGRDAKVLYYALELGSLLDDDEALLRELLRPLAHNPGSSGTTSELQNLRDLLARAR